MTLLIQIQNSVHLSVLVQNVHSILRVKYKEVSDECFGIREPLAYLTIQLSGYDYD